MTTTKLFWKDPYQTLCKAIVTSIKDNKVKLSQTVFFAFCGGQESDEGTIDGIKVLKATKLGDKEDIIDIEYELESAPSFQVGDEVKIIIDEQRRQNLMKLHTAAHIAYYFIVEKYGKMRILGSNIAEDKARVDFQSEIPLNDLEDIQENLNNYLSKGYKIKRSVDEKKPDLLWWSCSLGKMPCGGTHVKNTSEIGSVNLVRKTKGKGKERIELYLS